MELRERPTIHLSLQDARFLVRFSINGQALTVASGRSVPDLRRLIAKKKEVDAYTIQVPPDEAKYLVSRAYANTRFGPAYQLDESAQGITFAELTNQMKITLTFDERKRKPCFHLPEDTRWLGAEYFLQGLMVFYLTDARLSKIIQAKNLSEGDFIYLMQHLDEPYFNAEIVLDSQALYNIVIIELPNGSFEMKLLWRYPRNSWICPLSSSKYAVINQHVFQVPEEVLDDRLQQLFPQGDTRVVSREELIALYSRYRDLLLPFVDDSLQTQVAPFWFADELQLRYQCRVFEAKGRRASYAVPLLDIGGETYDARQISQQIVDGELVLQGRRLNLDTLLAAGFGPFGYFSDGRPLDDYPLKPEEILKRAFTDFNGVEHSLQLEEGLWCDEGTPRELLSSHVNFLLHFGLSGAAVLNGIPCDELMDDFVRDYLASPQKRAKTLIVLRKEHFAGLALNISSSEVQILQGLKSDPPLTFSAPVHLIHYAVLEKYPGIAQQKWDLVIFGEPEKHFKRISALYTKFCSLQSVLRFCLLSEILSYLSANVERLVTKLCKWRASRNWELDARLMRSLLPVSRPSMERERQREREAAAEHTIESFMQVINMQSAAGKAGTPIPLPTVAGRKLFGDFAVVRLTKVTPPHYYQPFLKEYRSLLTENALPCGFALCKISSSGAVLTTSEQRSWYLYWRSEFLKNNFLEGDEGYLFLMLVEIANGFSYKDREIGWQMLMNLMEHYSNIAPRLGNLMAEVAVDYALLYGHEKMWRDLLVLPALQRYDLVGNLQLQTRAIENGQILNLEEVLAYLGTDVGSVCAQCLSTNSSKEEIEEFLILLHRVAEIIQSGVLSRTGQSLYRFFTPARHHTVGGEVFHGLPNATDQKFTLSYYTWTRHLPLRDFWSAVFRESGNRFRRARKIKGQLKTGYLSDSYLEMIDSVLPRQTGKKSAATIVSFQPPKPLELSQELLEKLRGEAEEVQRALEAGVSDDLPARMVENTDAWINSVPAASGKPGFIYGFDGDLWQDFIDRLQSGQREALEFLFSDRQDAQALQALAIRHDTMPDLLLDEINELFMRRFGDLLIETDGAVPGINAEYREVLKTYLK